ncbi:MAG: hypothetical protein EPN98_08520 [Phenylobacterium sp.]|uniref:TylF/MycF/NovP-related O-methyltransferase n=1 Tax=Phenylobacterium sp. TaxID=1871053 RepID=UPI0012290C96|nr:TylF/MycF/NovP-related O-methyltransferase [Phenylobacterium sp.]TAL34684.1 MAG: hypothetical protein EPN98_08520 [Phenylobacterium sp.]
MSNLTLQDVTPEQLLCMGDGLLRGGQSGLAKSVYEVALKRTNKLDMRQRLRVRHGLAAAANHRTMTCLDLLETMESRGWKNAFVGDGLATWLKTLPFELDDRFQEISARHASLLPLANWQWNLTTMLWAVQTTRNIPGDFVELGVFKGHTTLFCADYVEFGGWPKTWWLYDTFEGIPEDQQNPGWKKMNDALYVNSFSYEEVAERFSGFPNIKVIKGRVPEVLQTGAPEQVALMHVDMNNAPAEIGALEFFFERLAPGGIIVFDDFCWATARTQYNAEVEWFAARGLHVLPMPTGQGVFVKS